MAFFPIHRYRFFDDPLDFFDPWDDSDTSVQPSAFRWINQPQRVIHSSRNMTSEDQSLPPAGRAVNAEKFRVQLNVAGFDPESIQTRVDGRQVIVEAKQEDRPNDDPNTQQIRKTYDLPEHADVKQLISYVTPNNLLVLEVPIRNPETQQRLAQAQAENSSLTQFGEYLDPMFDYVGFLRGSDFQSRIVDRGNNEKQLEMSIEMKRYRPEEIKISMKNHQLIVQGEHQQNENNRSERSFFFKSTTLPPGTQVEQLRTQLTDHGQLKIVAPFSEQQQNA